MVFSFYDTGLTIKFCHDRFPSIHLQPLNHIVTENKVSVISNEYKKIKHEHHIFIFVLHV